MSAQKEIKVNQIQVIQIGSTIGRKYDQGQTLIGLGLGKINKKVILENTPAIMGMIKKVRHLLKIEVIN